MFFTVKLSKDERVLSYGMNPFIRGIFLFFLVSILAMFIFNFSYADFTGASTFGKINIFFLPIFLILGSTYTFTIRMDKLEEKISIKKGFFPFAKESIYPMSALTAVVKRRVASGLYRERYIFGFIIDGRMILMDRATRKKQVDLLFGAFRAFFHHQYEILI